MSESMQRDGLRATVNGNLRYVNQHIIGTVVSDVLWRENIKSCALFSSQNLVLRATLRLNARKSCEVVVKFGKPNYAERRYLAKLAKSAGGMSNVSFPCERIIQDHRKAKKQ